MKFVIEILIIFVPAFIIGLGLIQFYWIGIPLIAAYGSSILFVSEQIGGDFRQLQTEDFMQKEKIIKTTFFGLAVMIAICYGIGRLGAWLF